jgi:hypothetical protein
MLFLFFWDRDSLHNLVRTASDTKKFADAARTDTLTSESPRRIQHHLPALWCQPERTRNDAGIAVSNPLVAITLCFGYFQIDTLRNLSLNRNPTPRNLS